MKEIDIEAEMKNIFGSSYAKKTDRQLWAYDRLSEVNKSKCKGVQPKSLQIFNKPEYRKCKLTLEQVNIIREKYKPAEYGILKLAKEFGVSKSVIRRIIEGKSWKNLNN